VYKYVIMHAPTNQKRRAHVAYAFGADWSSSVEGGTAINFGRFVSVVGGILSYLLSAFLLSTFMFEYPRITGLLKLCLFILLVLPVLSLFLFVGKHIDNSSVDGKGSVRGQTVFAAIPSALSFIGAAVLLSWLLISKRITNPVVRQSPPLQVGSSPTVSRRESHSEQPATGLIPEQAVLSDPADRVTVKVETTENHDGTETRTTTTTTIKPDGSKIVETKVETELYEEEPFDA
jgi:hypothetical protein